MRELFIRTDATPEIGAGHIMRCLALAQGLRRMTECTVTFVSRLKGAEFAERIKQAGCGLIELKRPHPDPVDLKQTLERLRQRRGAWLVLDGYHFDTGYQAAIRNTGVPLIVFDDYQDRVHYHADIIINQNLGAEQVEYLADPDTLVLAGADYVLLRPEFQSMRGKIADPRDVPPRARNLLVTMGGADPDNVTLKVMHALAANPVDGLHMRIVVGPSNPHEAVLKAALEGMDAELIRGANMPALMAEADLAVTAAGSTCWELAYLGVPMLCVVLTENQAAIARELDALGAAQSLGWAPDLLPENVSSAVAAACIDAEWRSAASRAGALLVDGKGPKRIARAIMEKNR